MILDYLIWDTMKNLYIFLITICLINPTFAQNKTKAEKANPIIENTHPVETVAKEKGFSVLDAFMAAIGVAVLFYFMKNAAPKAVSKTTNNLPIPRPAGAKWVDLIGSEVGNLNQMGPSVQFGGKLMNVEGDVETYVFMAKFSKADLRAEMQAKMEAEKARYFYYIKMLIGVIIFLLILLIIK
ncbi:MAG: hypothetical protein OHK0038_18100 [Flammeovirgaceae bacterium]